VSWHLCVSLEESDSIFLAVKWPNVTQFPALIIQC